MRGRTVLVAAVVPWPDSVAARFLIVPSNAPAVLPCPVAGVAATPIAQVGAQVKSGELLAMILPAGAAHGVQTAGCIAPARVLIPCPYPFPFPYPKCRELGPLK